MSVVVVGLLIVLFSGESEGFFFGSDVVGNLEVESSLVLGEQETLKQYRSATLRYKFNKEGYMTIIDQANREVGKLGFAVSGKVNGVRQMRTSQDFTWTKQVNEEIVNKSRQMIIWDDETNESELITIDESYIIYELVASNNNDNFPWAVTLNFDKNNDIKITNTVTNNLGSEIMDTIFWYINVADEGTKITHDKGEYIVSNNQVHKKGNFNDRFPEVRIGNYNFEYQDLIEEGFDITDIYIGNGSLIGHEDLFIVAVGVTKNNGLFPEGATVVLDPTTSDWIEPYANPDIFIGQFSNRENVFLSDNQRANSTSVPANISTNFNFLESDGGIIPDGAFINGFEFSVESRIDATPGTSTLFATLAEGPFFYTRDVTFAFFTSSSDNVKTFEGDGIIPTDQHSWFHKWDYTELDNSSFFATITVESANREVQIDQIRIRVYYEPPPVLNNTDDTNFFHTSFGDGNIINQNNTLIYLPMDLEKMKFGKKMTPSGTLWFESRDHLQNNLTVVPGIYGDAYKFDNSLQPYLAFPYREHTRGLTNITISAWINMTSISTRTIASQDVTFSLSGADVSWRLQNVVDRIRLITMNNTVPFGRSNSVNCDSADAVTFGEWQHVVATYNGTTTKMYINGSLSSTCTNQQGELRNIDGASNNLGTIRVGCRLQAPNTASCWDGGIDEFMLLDVALNESEVSALYNGEIDRFFPRSERIFTEQSLTGTNNTINLSITSATPLDSSINVSIGDGSGGTYAYGNEIATPYEDITIDNPGNFSIKFIFHSSTNNFLTPVMNNTFGFAEFLVSEVSDSCTYVGGNWDIDCSDNCSLTSNVAIDPGGNVSIIGTGTFQGLQNITNLKNLLIAVACKVK